FPSSALFRARAAPGAPGARASCAGSAFAGRSPPGEVPSGRARAREQLFGRLRGRESTAVEAALQVLARRLAQLGELLVIEPLRLDLRTHEDVDRDGRA